jgi:hypothetical protein
VLSHPLLNSADQSSEAANTRPVEFAMRNVTYHYSEPAAVHISQLQGELVPTKAGAIVFFDDKNSFNLRLSYAEISISCNALAQVLNENVFSSSDAPIKNLNIESKNNQLIMKGKLPQKAAVAFETVGTLSADPDGRIRVPSDHVKAAHLPVKGLYWGSTSPGSSTPKRSTASRSRKMTSFSTPSKYFPHRTFKGR